MSVKCFLCGVEEREEEQVDFFGSKVSKVHLSPCPHCQLISFCCDEHLALHRGPNGCFPFRILCDDKKGRYMVASRPIRALEPVLWEQPAVVGPYFSNDDGCLQCFAKTDKSFQCRGCGFWMCDEECASGSRHLDECRFLSQHVHTSRRPATTPNCITPLRMLLKRLTEPENYAKICMLQNHTKSMSGRHVQINLQMLKMLALIRDAPSMDNVTPHDMERMIGILKTNGMRLEHQGCSGVALYPLYCLINHACVNNTNYVKYPDFHLEVRAQVDIAKDEEITTRYISSTIGNLRRREDIRKFWFFECECARCQDATELGSFMSSIKCFNCTTGYLMAINSLEMESEWRCDTCTHTVSYRVIREVIVTAESQTLDKSGKESIVDLEERLFHFSTLFHPNHYILVDMMHNLVHLYTSKKVLSRPEKERKIQLCLIVLDVLGRVDPGYTKWRGTLLQELIHTVMMISKEDHENHVIDDKLFLRRLQFCAAKLHEARLCLGAGFTPLDELTKG